MLLRARGAVFHRLTMRPGNIGAAGAVTNIHMQKNALSKTNRYLKDAAQRTHDEWQKRFDSVLRKVHARSSQYTSEEIESDITRAVREVREEKR